ncbi:MAG: ABC transporter permease [Hyphomicrobium sp.]|uniref:ABC transporter permease n=1 Tax=Hyphomicrobium sp. TaxID=82 RepID=UPI0025C0BEE2|nr:ABC transporter permease [Hyphomicrobium sp.]MBX9861527.1 ABC transporter permease [Hyphomicrobium sp.]
MNQLLWLEALLKTGSGLALVLVPIALIRVLGLPSAGSGLWPRLLGAILIGCGAAAYIEGAWPGSRGLGLAGLVLINFILSGTLAATAMLGGGAPTRRGSFVIWTTVVTLFVLALVEIAHA